MINPLLKSMLLNMIKDDPAADEEFHAYLAQKMRSVAGLGEATGDKDFDDKMGKIVKNAAADHAISNMKAGHKSLMFMGYDVAEFVDDIVAHLKDAPGLLDDREVDDMIEGYLEDAGVKPKDIQKVAHHIYQDVMDQANEEDDDLDEAVKPMSEDDIKKRMKVVSDKIDKIVQGGGKVGFNDPLTTEMKGLRAQLKKSQSSKD